MAASPGPEGRSAAVWLQAVRSHLATSLVDGRTLEILLGVARQLPGDVMTALEIRLGSEPAAVDLSLRLARPAQALWMAERVSSPHLREFLRGWSAEPDGPASSVWLEFDLDREPSPPAVCAGLRGRAEPGWVADVLLPRLHGRPLTPRQRELTEACCAAIPEGARLLYAFSLLSRGAGEIRLEILGLDPAGSLRYLERTAPSALGQIAEVLPLFAGVERLHLSLDIGERISPRMGLEGSFVKLPHREPGWRGLFDRLVARGLCSPEKRDAVFAWPGYDSPAPGWHCVRSLSHVKVVTCPRRAPEAKVYFLVTPLRKLPPGGAPRPAG